MNWKFFVMLIVPMIRAAGEQKKAEDRNESGRDDLIGISLVYCADLLTAVVSGSAVLPDVPGRLLPESALEGGKPFE